LLTKKKVSELGKMSSLPLLSQVKTLVIRYLF